MDEHQFRRLLELFPVVRSSTYCADDDVNSSAASENAATSGRPGKSVINSAMKDGINFEKGNSANECESPERQPQKSLPNVSPGEGFWSPLKIAMQARLGDEEGQRFCDAFRKVHETLVRRIRRYRKVTKTLSLDDIERIATHMKLRTQYS